MACRRGGTVGEVVEVRVKDGFGRSERGDIREVEAMGADSGTG